jgi:hypothetical protein
MYYLSGPGKSDEHECARQLSNVRGVHDAISWLEQARSE